MIKNNFLRYFTVVIIFGDLQCDWSTLLLGHSNSESKSKIVLKWVAYSYYIVFIMASSHSPRTPTSPTATLKKDKKDDASILERIGTIGRKKKTKEGAANIKIYCYQYNWKLELYWHY